MFSGFSKPPWEFAEEDLRELVALKTPEGLHLEYKSSELLANKSRSIEVLTKEVSAFNNADGGTIVIGVQEITQDKLTYPGSIEDGVPASQFTLTWLTQIVQDNISPSIPELRIRAVPLSGDLTVKTAFVIYIPRGKQAVQAKDYKYYQRHEDQSVPIRDFQVRDVNNRVVGPDLRFDLAIPSDQRLARFTDTQRKLDITLSARNYSEALAEYAVFRVVLPESLAPATTTYIWSREDRQPEILLHFRGQQRKQATATMLRRLYQLPDFQAIFPGGGPVSLGTIPLIFRTTYESIPHLEPVVLMVAAPRMEPRVKAVVLSTDGSRVEMLEANESEWNISLDGKDALTYFREL